MLNGHHRHRGITRRRRRASADQVQDPGERRHVPRVTGIQWEKSDQASAQEFWENVERNDEPALFAKLGQWAGLC